jgi:AAA domain-containing protein
VSLEIKRLSLEDVLNPPEETFLLGNTFAAGKVSIIYGPTHVGKSAFMAGLLFHLAAEVGDYCGFELPDPPEKAEKGPGHTVLVYSVEDDRDDWTRKAAAQYRDWKSRHGEERAREMATLMLNNVWVVDRSGVAVRLSELTQVRTGSRTETVTRIGVRPTEERANLITAVRTVRPSLVYVETASQLVDSEDNSAFAALNGALLDVAQTLGSAVVVSHHPTKSASKESDGMVIEDVRGGGALTANAKGGVVMLRAATADEVWSFRNCVAAEDLVTFAQVKGTPSSPLAPPKVLARLGYPKCGIVFRLPEDVASDPTLQAAAQVRVEEEKHRRIERLALGYDAAETLIAAGPVSKNRLRKPLRDAGVTGTDSDLDDLVEEAIKHGVLKVSKRDRNGRILNLALGKRPSVFEASPPALVN